MKKLLLLIISVFIIVSFVKGQCVSTNNLTTFYGNNNGQDGIMFDVSASATSNTIIKCFDSNFNAGTFDVEIYYKVGTHVGFEVNAAAWTLAGTANGVVSTGVDVATYIPLVLNLTIPCSETYAFYITSTTGGMKYTNGTGVGNVLASNASLTIYEGTGKDYAFGMNFTPRQFNGTVYYDVTGSCGGCILTVNNPTICSGETATITANSTVVGTTYLWSTGATTNPITVSPGATTTYTVTGTTPIGQTCSASATVTVNPTPVITTSATSMSICLGESTTISASSSVGGTSYLWNTGATTNPLSVSPGATTTYTVTGTTASGCTGTASVTVTVNPNPTITASASPTAICVGTNSTISASSSVGGTTYNWNTGSTTNPITVSPGATTTYTVTGTTASGCTGTASVTVTVNANLSPTITAVPSSICEGSSTSLTAGNVPVGSTYNWSTGSTTNPLNVSPAATTSYQVTATDGNGCTGTATVSVTINPNPIITPTATPSSICIGTSSSISATSSVGGTTYTWDQGLGAGTSHIVSPAVTTTYTVTGTTANGCTGSGQLTVTVISVSDPTGINDTVCFGDIATVGVSGSTGNYSWYDLIAGGTLLGTGNTYTTPPLSATTTYYVEASSGAPTNCLSNRIPVLAVVVGPVIPDAGIDQDICFGDNINLTATGGTSYQWSTGQTNSTISVSPGTTTTYIVTVTDGLCSGTDDVVITVNPNPIITPTATPSSICLGTSSTISATSSVGGTTYTWDQGLGAGTSHIVSPAVTTTYTVTGSTASGCTGTFNVTITVNPNPTITTSASPTAICVGSSSTLSTTSSVSGTTYNWSTGSTTNPLSVSPLSTTTYTVTGTTASGCTGTSQVTVTVNSNLTPTITAAPSSICEGNSTSLTAGNVPVGSTYNWSTGSTLNPLNVTPAATTSYQVTATDGNGCTGTATVSVTVNPNPVISPTATPSAICLGTSSTLSASSSVGGTIYSWDQGLGAGTNHIVSPTVTTTYTITGTTANACTGTATVNVTVNPNPTISVIASPDSICSGTSSTLTSSSSIVGTNYAWSNGATTTNTQSVSPTVNTTYTVTGTTASGCTGSTTVSIFIKPDILPVITANPAAICLGNSSDITVSNIPSGSSFIWDNSSTTNPLTVSPLVTTTYSVTATTLEGCTGTTGIQVVVNPLPQIQVLNDTVCTGNIGSLLASGALTYLWSNTTTANPLTDNPSVTTIYTVTGTDGNGCSATEQGEIYVVDPPILVLSSTDAHCNQSDGSVTVVASGGTGVYMYSWNTTPISTTSTVNNVPPGTYSVTVTDNGCASVTSVNVGNISGPIAAFIADPTEANINEDIIFTDLSIGAIDWNWDFDDGGTSILQNPTHAYASQGIYEVWLYIEDNNGCIDSTTARIIINQLFTIYIPNAFSPDGNGVNEIFIPSGMGIDEDRYVMQIYDRWGNRIFETTDIGIGWDGNIEGQEISEMDKMSAVFVYYIKLYEDGTDVSHEYRGTITLLK
jgi:gliding motility-associated-like protein